jgi:hypothetical protein
MLQIVASLTIIIYDRNSFTSFTIHWEESKWQEVYVFSSTLSSRAFQIVDLLLLLPLGPDSLLRPGFEPGPEGFGSTLRKVLNILGHLTFVLSVSNDGGKHTFLNNSYCN